jgi:hypothetical protein
MIAVAGRDLPGLHSSESPSALCLHGISIRSTDSSARKAMRRCTATVSLQSWRCWMFEGSRLHLRRLHCSRDHARIGSVNERFQSLNDCCSHACQHSYRPRDNYALLRYFIYPLGIERNMSSNLRNIRKRILV